MLVNTILATVATPSPAPTVTSTPPSHANLILWLIVGGIGVAGVVVAVGRWLTKKGPPDPSASFIRSWIAIALVIGLLVFCAATLLGDDTSLQNVLFGGFIASTGSAIAYYFSSQGADKARADILSAVGTIGQDLAKPSKFSQLSPPDGKVDVEYPTYRIVADGSPAPTYWVASGKLPDGLTLDTDGTLHGTPTPPKGDSDPTFEVAAINSAGILRSPDLTIRIEPAQK